MHVCVDARLCFSSGIGTLLRSVLEILNAKKSIRTSLLCRSDDEMKLKNYGMTLIKMKSPLYGLSEQLEYALKIPKCDLFWSFHFNVPLLPIRAKKRAATLCDVYHLAHLKQLNFFQRIYAAHFYNAVFSKSDLLSTISEFSKQEIAKYARSCPKSITISRPPFAFSSHKKAKKPGHILFVGNIKPHKNLLRLVMAYARIKPSLPLYLVGKKEGFNRLDSSVFDFVARDSFLNQNVKFLGEVDDDQLKKLYAEALCLVFPSTYEGFGYPPLEAMKSSCPVIASNAASIPEVCGDAALYVDPYSVDAIAAAMNKMIEDPNLRHDLIEKGLKQIERKCQEKNQFELLVEDYARCCGS